MTAAINPDWRQVIYTINNTTGYTLELVEKKVIHGRFDGEEPPKTIPNGTLGKFIVNKNDLGSTIGPEGTVTYKIALGGGPDLKLVFYWNHPQGSAKSVYSVSSEPVGHVTYAVAPSNPTGHNQSIVIEPVLQHLARVYDEHNWMGALSGDLALSEISIPGTHDSGATKGGYLVQCQRLSLADQFELGIRFIDIRLKRVGSRDNKVLRVFHGGFEQPLTFPEVIAQCQSFLEGHPGETILMLVNDEARDQTEPQEFASLVDKHIDEAKAGLFHSDPQIPSSLKEVRGKVVLLRRYSHSTKGIDCRPWPHNTAGPVGDGKLYAQDYYKVEISDHIAGTISAAEKLGKIRDAMTHAKNYPNEIVLNFTSGFGSLGPLSIANYIHEDLSEMLSHYGKGRTGVVILDFADELFGNLVRYTVSTNVFPERPV